MANESRTARPIMSFCIVINLRPPLRNHLEELGNGAKRQGREEAQGTDQQNDEHEQEYEHIMVTIICIFPTWLSISFTFSSNWFRLLEIV